MLTKKNLFLVPFLIFGLVACQNGGVTSQTIPTLVSTAVLEPTVVPATPAPTATQPSANEETDSTVTPLETMLAYLPAEWADLDLPVPFGPAVHFIDVQQLREDMAIEPVTGASSATDKRQLVIQLGLNVQGIAYVPPALQPTASSAFDEWGWDMADVRQLLYLPDLEVAVFKGDFSRPEIQSRLQGKGYTFTSVQDFTFFTTAGDSLAFAQTMETLIVGETSHVEDIIQFVAGGGESLDTHPAVHAVLDHLTGVWGAVLAPSPNLVGFSSEVGQQMDEALREILEERYPKSEVEPTVWDFMAIGFQGAETSSLTIVYHYPSADEANTAVPLVEKFLTETPSFTSPGATWGDLMMLQEISAQDSAVVATAETQAVGLIGNAFERRDYFAFLPVEP